MRPIHFLFLIVISMFAFSTTSAEDDAATIAWQANATDGSAFAVPNKDAVTVLAFVMSDQDRSDRALKAVHDLAATRKAMQVVAIVSGKDAQRHAEKLAAAEHWPHPVVADPDYEASGKLHVRVWPTTVIVDSQGKQTGRIAGLPTSLAKQLDAYVKRAAGDLDDKGLEHALNNNEVIASTDDDAATRHREVARRLINVLQLDEARKQIDEGLKLKPGDARLLLLAARLDVLTDKPGDAIKRLDTIKVDALPAWQTQALRGRALVQLEQWDNAEKALSEGLKLNPDPSETWYFLGRVYEATKRPEKASHAYRRAFETAPFAQRIGVKASHAE